MIFSIIYSVDIPSGLSITHYKPPNNQMRRKLWQCTEGDSSYEYGHLGEEWEKGKHRKYCAVLTRKEFEQFTEECELFAQNHETGGSIGAPGFEIGWVPAVSFSSERYSAIVSAYVTPIPTFHTREQFEARPSKLFDEDDWERVRRAVINQYGSEA